MQDDLEPFEFVLAEKLGMTVERLLTGDDRPLSNREHVMWCAFYVWRNAMFEMARETRKT